MVREHHNDNGASWNASSAEAVGRPESAHRRVGARRTAFVLALFMAVSIGLSSAVYVLGNRMASRSAPLIEAALEVRLNLSLFHLWFEELVQGDTSVRSQDVWAYLADAEQIANTMMDGGGPIVALEDELRRAAVHDALASMVELRLLALQRLQDSLVSRAGSDIDQEFDAGFFRALSAARGVQDTIQARMDSDLARFQVIGIGFLTVLVLFAGIVGVVLVRYEKRSTADLRRIRESRGRLLTIVEHAPVGIMMTRFDGTILHANPAFRRMVGFSLAELQEKGWLAVTHPDDRAANLRWIEHAERLNLDGFAMEKRFLRKDGAVCWSNMISRVVRDSEGVPQFSIVVHEDVTESRQARDRIERLQAELAQASRLSVLGEMAAGFAHELNQPLTAITAYAHGSVKRMRDGTADDESIVDVIEKMGAQAHRAGEIIRRIRAFAKPRESGTSVVDLREAIEWASSMMRTEARLEGVDLIVDIGDDVYTVAADAVEIQQVLLNLVRNGIEALDHASGKRTTRVTIRAHRVDDGHVEVAVEDDGPGIPADRQGQLFHPFFTTKESGMGIGLSICQSIMERNGSRLNVESDAGRGARFLFRLAVAA